MTTQKRTLSTLLAAAVAAIALAGLVISPAGATAREEFEVHENKVFQKAYPAIVGKTPNEDANGTGLVFSPANCKTYAFCDTIPFKPVLAAPLAEGEDSFLLIEISWKESAGPNDMDAYIWDDGQIKGGTATQLSKADTLSNPEKLRLARPELDKYNLVVHNTSGVNQGYTVKATITKSQFESPFEQLAPPREPPKDEEEEVAPPEDKSAAPPSTGTTDATLPPSNLGDDDGDFEFGESTFDQDVAINLDELRQRQLEEEFANAARQKKASKVPTWALLASFVGTPALVVGGTGAVLLRRRKNLLF